MPQAPDPDSGRKFPALLYAKRHPLAGNDGLTPWDFRAERFLVVMDENPHAGDLVTQYCAPYGFSPRLLTVPNIDSLVAEYRTSKEWLSWTAGLGSAPTLRLDIFRSTAQIASYWPGSPLVRTHCSPSF